MVKRIQYLILTCMLAISCSIISCKTPEGCAAADNYRSESNLETGEAKRGSSNLFSKKQRKKMKKRGQ